MLLPESVPPAMVIALQSREILELTVTKTFIGVLSSLTEAFAAIREDVKTKALSLAPFIVKNHTGRDITLLLDNRGFKYYMSGEKPGERSKVLLPRDRSEVHLFLARDRTAQANQNAAIEYVSPLREQTEQAEAGMRLKVDGEAGTAFEVPVSKADVRFFPFKFRGDEMGDVRGLVSEVTVVNGCKHVTLRSVVKVKNHFERSVNVFAYDGGEGGGDGDCRYVKLASLKPDESFDVPLRHVYSPPYEFYFQVDGEGQNMGLKPYCWRQLLEYESHSVKVHCKNRYTHN